MQLFYWKGDFMSSVGNKGKFSEKIKRIAVMKKKKKIVLEDSDMIYKNFLKVVAAIPLMVYDNVVDDNMTYENNEYNDNKINNGLLKNNKRVNKEKISGIDISLIKKNQENKFLNTNRELKESEINKINEARMLEKKIINLIKKNLITTVNELEILQSELYIINEVHGDDKILIECQRNLDEVKKNIM